MPFIGYLIIIYMCTQSMSKHVQLHSLHVHVCTCTCMSKHVHVSQIRQKMPSLICIKNQHIKLYHRAQVHHTGQGSNKIFCSC